MTAENRWKAALLGPLGVVLDLLRLQEPWSYSRFLKIYNRHAESRGGWHFEPDGRTPEELRHRYRSNALSFRTLRGFAESLFEWDQRLNL